MVVLRDLLHTAYQGVLCCRNAIRFYEARLKVISFRAIRKVLPFMRCSHETDFTEIG